MECSWILSQLAHLEVEISDQHGLETINISGIIKLPVFGESNNAN